MPPGSTGVCLQGGGLRIVQRGSASRDDGVARFACVADAGAAVRDALRDEVQSLLAADVAACSIASGGLDSSIVTALAAESSDALHTFHIGYRGRWPLDERGFAAMAARDAGATHHEILVDPAEIPKILPTLVKHLGQPNADPIVFSTYMLFAGVREHGFKLALSGDGADEIFCGYDRLRDALARPADDGWIADYLDALAAVPSALRSTLYTDAYRAYLADEGTAHVELYEDLALSGEGRLRTLLDFEERRRLPAYHLRRVDHLSMAHGVEVRVPFCQRRVVRLARALPEDLLVRGGEVKRALYAAAEGLVPGPILKRPKQPFTLPIVAMLRPGQPLWDMARTVLAPGELRRDGLVDPAAVDTLFGAQAERPTPETALAVWALLVHALWLDQHRAGVDIVLDRERVA